MDSVLKKAQPLIVWGTSDLYFILAVTITILFGVLSPDLQKQLHFSNPQLGFLGFGFFLSFGITQLLTGGLIDSWGPRYALTLSACIAAIGLLLLTTAESFYQAFLGQIIAGAGLSTSYVGTIYLASMWFSQKYFSLIAGITLMSANIISASLITFMALADIVTTDFRIITSAFTIVSLIMALLLFSIVRKSPDSNLIKAQPAMFWDDLYKLVQIPQFWLGAIYFSTTIGVYLAFSSLWNIPDSLAYGHSLKTATMLSATLRYGTALGAILSGLIASYSNRSSMLVKCYSSGALLAGIIMVYGPLLPLSMVFLIFALLGFFFGGAALGFPLVGQYIPQTLKGTGFGLMAAMGYLLCALLQYLTGLVLGYQNSPPTIHAFTIALTPLVMTLAIGWFCTLWLRDKVKQ